VSYCAGGGGFQRQGSAGSGGSTPSSTYGGGSTAAFTGSNAPGQNGVVILRYRTGSMTATGGTITTAGGYTIHTFTANGTFQVTS